MLEATWNLEGCWTAFSSHQWWLQGVPDARFGVSDVVPGLKDAARCHQGGPKTPSGSLQILRRCSTDVPKMVSAPNISRSLFINGGVGGGGAPQESILYEYKIDMQMRNKKGPYRRHLKVLQVQFGLFPICREGEWNWTRLLVVCTPYLAMYVSTSVPQAFQAISINHFCCHSGWPHRQVKQDVAILRGVRYWRICSLRLF